MAGHDPLRTVDAERFGRGGDNYCHQPVGKAEVAAHGTVGVPKHYRHPEETGKRRGENGVAGHHVHEDYVYFAPSQQAPEVAIEVP